MIEEIKNLPDSILGFVYKDTVTGDDYEKVIFPAVDKATKSGKPLRLICQFSDSFAHMDMKAMADDAKIGLRNYNNWEKIAIVSDHHWLNHIIKAFSFVVPGKLKVYPVAEYEAAVKWVAGD